MGGQFFSKDISAADFRSVARALTIVENELDGSAALLKSLRFEHESPIVGITGPPGAGKSTLVNALIEILISGDKKIAILCIDPTSPFNFGSLLGDRIRMVSHFNHPDVFIRSVATRGSLGGLSLKTMEMADILRAAGFDYVIIETVGVGQSEVEIAGLADKTLVVLVPEAGDEIQSIKSGLMEIADAFIVNKADREGAAAFAGNLRKLVHQKADKIPVFETIATDLASVEGVASFITSRTEKHNERRELLLFQRLYTIIQARRMANVDREKLRNDLKKALGETNLNLYSLADRYA
jgi:LAO/AO transport system kinase